MSPRRVAAARRSRPSPGVDAGASVDDESAPIDAATGAATPSRAEWTVAAASAALVVAVIGFLLTQADRPGEVPDLHVAVESVDRVGDFWVVAFVAANRSRATAAEVGIEGAVGGAGSVERSTVTIDFVPGGSRRRGSLVFRSDAAASPPALRVVGFRRP